MKHYEKLAEDATKKDRFMCCCGGSGCAGESPRDAFKAGYLAAVEMLRSDEAKHAGKDMKNYDSAWGLTLMAAKAWADWLMRDEGEK